MLKMDVALNVACANVSPARMLRRALLLCLAVAGCHPAAPPITATLPDLSRLAAADPIAPVTPPSCRDGFQLTEVPRRADSILATRGSDGTWHVVYLVSVTYNGQQLTGLRYVTSSNPAVSESIAWSSGIASITLGPDSVPTVFFSDWSAPLQPIAITRARRINGAWHVDPLPIWTDKDDHFSHLEAVIDDANHAHVLVVPFITTAVILSDATGSWVATPVTSAQFNVHATLFFAVDKAGHDYVELTTFDTGPIVFTNVSGVWSEVAASTGILRRDSQGDVHAINLQEDRLTDLDITAGSSLRVLGAQPVSMLDAAFGPSPNPVILGLISENNYPVVRLWSDVNGTYQAAPVPASPDGDAAMAVDTSGKAHIALSIPTGMAGGFPFGFVEPCP
jgi:hypothetical protein